MAKGRRPSRSKKHPPVLTSTAEARQEAASAKAADRAETDELAERLIALRSEVSEARAGADARMKANSRGRFRRGDEAEAVADDVFYGTTSVADVVEKDPRRRWLAVLIAVLAAVAVLLGLIVAGNTSSSKKTPSDPVASYLNAHVPSGTTIGVVGNLAAAVPANTFSPVQIDSPTSAAIPVVKYIVAPYPATNAGAMSGFLTQNAKKVAVSASGTVGLYYVQSISTTKPTSPVTTHSTTPATAAVTVPATTHATVPATTVATVPVTTVVTVPATTPPTTSPPTTSPPTTSPPTTTPPTTTVTNPPPGQTGTNPGGNPSTSGSGSGATATGGTTTQVVAAGSSFWTIAAAQVQKQLGATPTTAQIGHYWAQLLAANTHNLPHPGDPNLIYAGQTIVLPAA